jgi:predicted nucleic acid-binding protein
MTLIFNASPLIILAKSGLLDCFINLSNDAWIPQAVADEVSRVKNPDDPARCWLAGNSAIVHPLTPISRFVTAWDLGDGESAVISLAAAKPESIAVLDDLAARRCAQAMDLRMIGTIGLILMAKQAGLIESATHALEAVTAAGLFISSRHLDAIRIQAGES